MQVWVLGVMKVHALSNIIVCINKILVKNQLYIDNLLILVTVSVLECISICKFKQPNKENNVLRKLCMHKIKSYLFSDVKTKTPYKK